MISRVNAIVSLLFVTAQVFAPRSAAMVCRYTGQIVVTSCPCPAERAAVPRLAPRGCCDIRPAPAPLAPARVGEATSFPGIALAVLPVTVAPSATTWAPGFRVRSQDPPQSQDRYLFLSNLLI